MKKAMKTETNKSIILLSGGLDSVVSLGCTKDAYNITLALTFDYGQRAGEKEVNSSKKIAEYYGLEHKVISLPCLAEITSTSLVNKKSSLPELKVSELDNIDLTTNSAKNVWVPNRNGLFINIAASFADSYNFTHIIFGANKEEGTTFPDNTQDFIDKINDSLEFSTLSKPKVFAPLIKNDKAEIVKIGIDKKIPFNLIRSCYTNNEKHCGKCESCLRFKRALQNTVDKKTYYTIFEAD
ncbi:MAG: 7-cyano-7-deazaguanine synthase QueC [Candidatus Gastranaerophilales bacterium]|nr:7-cyano-7-deazaguanine synthase QueC [Candidatus Gastranaerophilales bacterium]